jgi:3-hydroxyisobutyrate dehydrogenase-like beta-hydroxyacid dehydrogenase
VKPLLELFGGSVFHVGPAPGQGQTVKLLNNLLSATAMAVTSEALTFGVSAGLDAATMLEVFNAGSGRNTATAQKFPAHVLTRRFASGFRLELMAKDVELCLAEARGTQFPMLIGGLIQQIWTLARAQSPSDADHTEVVRLFERWAGVEVTGDGGE